MKLEQIHEDSRGKIALLLDAFKNLKEVTVFVTSKGFARGGCVHKFNDEYCTVIEGMVEYRLDSRFIILGPGESLTIQKNTPHYFVALEDSVVLEWGATPKEKQEKDEHFRKIVDEINKHN